MAADEGQCFTAVTWSLIMMDSFPKIGGFSHPNHALNIGFSVINHPFWGTPIFGSTHIDNNNNRNNDSTVDGKLLHQLIW